MLDRSISQAKIFPPFFLVLSQLKCMCPAHSDVALWHHLKWKKIGFPLIVLSYLVVLSTLSRKSIQEPTISGNQAPAEMGMQCTWCISDILSRTVFLCPCSYQNRKSSLVTKTNSTFPIFCSYFRMWLLITELMMSLQQKMVLRYWLAALCMDLWTWWL